MTSCWWLKNHPSWEYFHHGNMQMLQIKVAPLLIIWLLTTSSISLTLKTWRNPSYSQPTFLSYFSTVYKGLGTQWFWQKSWVENNIKVTVRKYWVINTLAWSLVASSLMNSNTQFHFCSSRNWGAKVYVCFHDQDFRII